MNISVARRAALPFVVCCLLAMSARTALANDPTPASGTLSASTPTVSFSAGPFPLTNESYAALPEGMCSPNPPFRCDDFALTVDLPDNYDQTNANDLIRFTIAWDNKAEDYDIYVLDAEGNSVTANHLATGADPETYDIPAGAGLRQWTVRVVPFTASGGTINATIELVTPPPVVIGPPPLAPTGIAPRFYVYAAPPGMGEAGEPSIGYNPFTKRAMTLGTGGGTGPAGLGGQVLQITFPENLDAPMPEACDAGWVDVTPAELQQFNVDGILVTDPATGRTFASELLSVGTALLAVNSPLSLFGFNSIFAYSDDDGASWTPGGIGPPQTTIPPGMVGTSPVDGLDHQTVGVGPYVAGATPAGASYDNAVYYCSQGYIEAFCTRSDDGGLTFPSTGVVVYTTADDGCGGLHGHIRIAPDGTAYLPNKNCNGHHAVAVSEDNGETWEVREQPNSSSPEGLNDPQMALASDGTGYLCWVGGDGHPHVTVTKDKGKTWINDYDIGYYQGIQNAVFAQAIAGDPDRAACFFIGTTTAGNLQSLDFTGIWYPFVATTYDGGLTWHTVNVSPDDPVQREGGIWLQGGSATNRNLLDFNEVTIDERGRVLAIYADGCINQCVQSGPNSFSSHTTLARLIGQRPLYAAFDPPEQQAPLAACLAGKRDQFASHLTWRLPDSGGADIAGYRIYRGTTPDTQTLLLETSSTKPRFTDTSVDAGVSEYSYKITAINNVGEGLFSNIVTLPVTDLPILGTPCALPGVTPINDPSGDNTNGPPGTDIAALSIAEPADMEGKLVFTIKVDALPPAPESGFRWVVYFKLPEPPANGDEDYYVAMAASNGPPNFEYGTHFEMTGGVGAYRPLGQLDPASGFSTDGTIVLVLDKAEFSALAPLDPGTQLTGILAATRTSAPIAGGTGGQGLTLDNTEEVGYSLRGAEDCVVARGPLAVLLADVTSGPAPLTVHFDGGESTDPDGIAIASYTFNFGDGSPEVTQSQPEITHTYAAPGAWAATLKVANAQAAPSTNEARTLINVTGTIAQQTAGNPRFGGAFAPALLGLFSLAAAWRRRRR